MASFSIRMHKESAAAAAVVIRKGCPARQPSPTKPPALTVATTASLPRSDVVVSLILPSRTKKTASAGSPCAKTMSPLRYSMTRLRSPDCWSMLRCAQCAVLLAAMSGTAALYVLATLAQQIVAAALRDYRVPRSVPNPPPRRQPVIGAVEKMAFHDLSHETKPLTEHGAVRAGRLIPQRRQYAVSFVVDRHGRPPHAPDLWLNIGSNSRVNSIGKMNLAAGLAPSDRRVSRYCRLIVLASTVCATAKILSRASENPSARRIADCRSPSARKIAACFSPSAIVIAACLVPSASVTSARRVRSADICRVMASRTPGGGLISRTSTLVT